MRICRGLFGRGWCWWIRGWGYRGRPRLNAAEPRHDSMAPKGLLSVPGLVEWFARRGQASDNITPARTRSPRPPASRTPASSSSRLHHHGGDLPERAVQPVRQRQHLPPCHPEARGLRGTPRRVLLLRRHPDRRHHPSRADAAHPVPVQRFIGRLSRPSKHERPYIGTCAPRGDAVASHGCPVRARSYARRHDLRHLPLPRQRRSGGP